MTKTITAHADGTWAREHQLRWELAPLVEMVKGHGMRQTAWTLTVYGRFDPTGMDDPATEAARIHARLEALVTEATRGMATRVQLHFLPAGRAVVPPDAQQHLDVELLAIASSVGGLAPAGADLRSLPGVLTEALGQLAGRKA